MPAFRIAADDLQGGPVTWKPASERPHRSMRIKGPVVPATTSTEYQGDDRLIQVAPDVLADEPFTVVTTSPSGAPGGGRRFGSLHLPATAINTR